MDTYLNAADVALRTLFATPRARRSLPHRGRAHAPTTSHSHSARRTKPCRAR